MRLSLRLAFFPLCLLLTSVLTGCGGGSSNAAKGTSISVVPTTANMKVGDVLQLHAVAYDIYTNQNVTPKGSWVSSNADVVKVNSEGLISAASEGNAIVSFVSSGQSIDVTVAVVPRATSLTISPVSADIKAGSSFQFAAAGVVDGKEQDLTNLGSWSLDNSLFGGAEVQDGGLLITYTGAVTTQTIIHVTVSYGGLKASAPVFVNP